MLHSAFPIPLSSEFFPWFLHTLWQHSSFSLWLFSAIKNPAGLVLDFWTGLAPFICPQQLSHLFCSLKHLQPFPSTEMLHFPHSSMSQGSVQNCGTSSRWHLAVSETSSFSLSSGKHISLTLRYSNTTEFPNKTSLSGTPSGQDGRHCVTHLAWGTTARRGSDSKHTKYEDINRTDLWIATSNEIETSHLPFLLYMFSRILKLGLFSQGTNVDVVFHRVSKSWFLTSRSYEYEIHRYVLCFPQHLMLLEVVLNTTSFIFTERRVNNLVWRSVWSRTLQMSAYIHAPFNRCKQQTNCSGFL